FLWMLGDPGRLSPQAAAAIQNPERSVFVSAVTAVEIAIKRRLGKLEAPEGLDAEIASRGLLELPLKFRHGERLLTLSDHHQDPFDRMLIAQAMEEDLTLITHDRKMEPYGGIKILWS
ncbi:MAG TPA: type II toxin-antitoxin system VapC family toxin, partial [Chthoniobacterales bacterium]